MKILISLVLLMMTSCPVLPQSYLFNVVDYGARGDGKAVSTTSIQQAVNACADKGGGTVCFPAGRYISGTIFLKSYVNLYFESGAVLEGSKNLNDYPETIAGIRSYTDTYTNKSLIYGEDLEYISITGRGIIDGNGASFKVSDEFRRADLSGSYKARPYMIRIINCKNVVVNDITLLNSPMWVQHYMACTNVNIDGITVSSRVNNNNDGIDIDGCENVRISNCDITSGDDAIVLKSTMDRPCRNVTITNCTVSSNCNAFKLGTESNGGFKNIALSNCTFYDTRLAGIALEMVDGGSLDNVSVSGIDMDNVNCPVFVRLGNRARPYKEDMEKPGIGKLFNVMISDIQATNIGTTGCSVTGLPSFPCRDILLNNIRMSFKGGGTEDLAVRTIEEFPEKYPEYGMFGMLPAYGFFCRHVEGLTMKNVELSFEKSDFRPALFMDDITSSEISGLKASSEEKTESVIILSNSKNIVVSDCISSKKSGVLAVIKNAGTDICFIDNKILSGKVYKSDGSAGQSGIIVR